MKRILITGANRGLGLELTRQYLASGAQVFAAARQPAAAIELQSLQNDYPDHLTLVTLDVTDETSIAAAYQAVQAKTDGLEILINNAGTYPGLGGNDPATQRLGNLTTTDALHVMQTNALGPLLVAQQFLDLLRAGSKGRILSLSSGLGSLTWKSSGDPYHYSASKAAMNMYMRSLAAEIGHQGLISVVVDPGWVRTGMGGAEGTLTATDSAQGIIRLADQLHTEENGSFVTWQGQTVPW